MGDKLRILIVDDEPDVADVLKVAFEPDFEVVVAVNGLDALLKVPRVEPDLLIIDLMMPLMDGWELAKQVRALPDHRDTPMIFLSALDSPETIRKGYAAGADVYITKPFDPERVRRNVQVFVERDSLKPRAKQFSLYGLYHEGALTPAPAPTHSPAPASHESVGHVGPVGPVRQTPAPPHVPSDPSGPPSPTPPRVPTAAPRSGLPPTPSVRQTAAPSPSPSTPSPSPHSLSSPSPSAPSAVSTPLPARKISPRPTSPPQPEPAPATVEPSSSEVTPVAMQFAVRPRVLLVDDDDDLVDVLRAALQRGFEVARAHSGIDALVKIPELQPDVYIIDIMMPGMNGYQLLQVLRQSADTREAPVIVLSGRDSPRDRDHARLLGADGFMAKPFDAADLIGELERQIQRPGFRVKQPKKKTLDQLPR